MISLTPTKWELLQVPEHKNDDLCAALADGWEPFAAVLVHGTVEVHRGETLNSILCGRPDGQRIVYCLRRLVPADR
jgi:hypothetical protein